MSDNTFEKALTVLTIAIALLIAAGVALSMWIRIYLIPIIIVALVALIVGGILLLYFWGKSYMARR